MQKFIITGSSKGIGGALTRRVLAEPDTRVTGISRGELPPQTNYQHVSLDLSDTTALLSAVKHIFEADQNYERIVLINNAGYLGEVKHVGKIDGNDFAKVYAINVTATAILMNEFIRSTKNLTCEKIIINISSGAGRKSDYDGWAAYSSSKAAVDRLSEIIDKECKLDGHDYKIYALAPGVVETDMQLSLRKTDKIHFSHLERFISLKKDGIIGQPAETAEKILRFINRVAEYPEVIQDLRQLNL